MDTFVRWLSVLPIGMLQMNPLSLVNHVLQVWCFSNAVSNIISLILKIINFAYAQQISSSYVARGVGFVLVYYLKIWDHYSGLLYIASIFSLTFITFYVYDCCGNISQSLDDWKQHNRDLAVILSFCLMLSTSAFLIWQIYKSTQNPLLYPYPGIYFLQILSIVVGNLLRRRSIIYSLLGVLAINYLIVARHFLHKQYSASNWIQMMQLPVETAVYFTMAIDAQKRQRDTIKSQTLRSLFFCSFYLAVYSLLNDSSFPLELILGGVFIFGLIINR